MILLSTIISEIHSLPVSPTGDERGFMNNTKVSSNNNAKEQSLLRGSSGFGIYIGGGSGGLVGLILLIVIIYFFCFRKKWIICIHLFIDIIIGIFLSFDWMNNKKQNCKKQSAQ